MDTLHTYLENVIKNGGEEKYRRIRISNKVFQGRVKSQKGGMEFLKAAGWTETLIDNEPFLIYAGDVQTLIGNYFTIFSM